MTRIVRLSDHLEAHGRSKRRAAPVYFDRAELNCLLGLYSRHVAKGEWRDYAIGHDPGMARFSIFRHSHDRALFTVVKQIISDRPRYSLFEGERKMRQSGSLDETLAPLSKPLKLLSRS